MPRNDTSVYDYIFFSRQLLSLVIIIVYGINLSLGLIAVPDSCLYVHFAASAWNTYVVTEQNHSAVRRL